MNYNGSFAKTKSKLYIPARTVVIWAQKSLVHLFQMPTLPIMTIKRACPPDALMNLATYLPQLNGQALEQRIRAVGRRLPSWVSYLLIIIIAYKLAELTWILLPQGTSSAQKPTTQKPTALI